MSTFNQLTESTLLYLYGYTTLQDQATYLTADINSSTTTIPIADATSISRGTLEIDNELIWVDSVDTTALTATAPPYGRGYRGSVAATHTSGTRVVSSPLFPRRLVQQAINETIHSVYPDLFGVAETTFTYNPAISTYALPAGATQVLAVSWQSIGPSREWLPIRRYRLDQNAATGVFASGTSISIYDPVVPGRTIKVLYAKVPSTLNDGTDDFATVTGLSASAEDLIRLGAAFRMVPFFDSPHLAGNSAEADFTAQGRPVGGASQLGRYLLQMYQIRLSEETRRLQDRFPVRTYYTR